MRPAMTAVLPEPAPASTRNERSWTAMAARLRRIVRKRLSPRGHHTASQTRAASPRSAVAAGFLARAVDGAGIGGEREGEIVIRIAGVLAQSPRRRMRDWRGRPADGR